MKERIYNSTAVVLIVGIVLVLCVDYAVSDCGMNGLCNGHGRCLFPQRVCSCDEGWGSESDIATYKSLVRWMLACGLNFLSIR
jgi:hypothetical protein